MSHRKATTLFFAGTDTDVGKTYVASLAAARFHQQGKRVGVYKPVASGCRETSGQRIADDAVALWNAAGRPGPLDDVCPQKFAAPLAPPEAARLEGRRVDIEQMSSGLSRVIQKSPDVVIVEGAGGLMSPIADGFLNLDLIKRLDIDHVVIVAANRLGVIHHTLATVAAAAHFQIDVRGIILSQPVATSDPSCQTNAAQISRYSEVPVIGNVDHGDQPEAVAFLDALIG